MDSPAVRLPFGVRDFLPRAAARRREIAERLLAVFEAWGYARIITPAYECADVLERGLGADARAAAVRFVEPVSGEVVALRPDITPQVARVVASRLADAPGPLRLCYEGSVTRLLPGQGQREILQAGIELVELAPPVGDAELLAVATAAMDALGLAERHLDLGHVAFARSVLQAIDDAALRERLRAALAHKDRRAARRCAAELPPSVGELAAALVELWGPAPDVLRRAEELKWPAPAIAALAHLRQVLATYRDIAGPMAIEPELLGLDLGEVRGFDYYSGLRISGHVGGAPEAVLSGGRYDGLLARYGRDAPATGFSVDIEAVALAQRALGVPAARRGLWLALCGAPGDLARSAALARALRAAGARVALVLEPKPWPQALRGAHLDAVLLIERGRFVTLAGAEHDVGPALAAVLAELTEPARSAPSEGALASAHILLELVAARVSEG